MADLQLHTLLLCDYALTAQDGKISAIGVFSQINVSRLPATHGRCFIVAILEASPGPHELSFQVVSPTGKNTLQQAPRIRIEVPQNATLIIRGAGELFAIGGNGEDGTAGQKGSDAGYRAGGVTTMYSGGGGCGGCGGGD